MDLKTKYMGLELRSPLVVSASPLSEKLDNIRKMEDCGAGALVLYSLFEEQIKLEQLELDYHTTIGTEAFAESLSYFPDHDEYKVGPDQYLELIRKAKHAVDIPVIASLNGSTEGGWTEYARKMEEAGADALELNIYYIPTNPDLAGSEVENTYLKILQAVKNTVDIPVALKISPFFTNMANMAKKLDEGGANALVLFNRFYQPDIDLENLEVFPNLLLSSPASMRLPMRWIAILKGNLKADLAATGGIHSGEDAIKMMMVGANVTMFCSILLRNGIEHLKTIESEMVNWLKIKEYESVSQLIGSMSKNKAADPSAFERAQYMKAITKYNLGY
ncbi:MAG TPA: dihydroorotate dehydrogenase-like protein [Ignavibacteria bacterium]|nr:dihydroorotate dehydrogenase-like protein [Ignavibacteria bacterium]HMR41133.1 dihydroorotate dehydrogenase-like protein [Ignavibacteria bacterium]